MNSTARLILIVVFAILLIGALPLWPYSGGWGYWPSGALGLVVIALLIFALMNSGPGLNPPRSV